MLPNFIIIGAMKGGTTSLFRLMRQHPEIYMPPLKEPMFFSRDKKWRLGLEWYESVFIGHRSEKRVGEASTTYTKTFRSREVAERMHKVLPEARLIYILRNPVDRMFSQHKHLVVNGLRANFADSLKKEDYLDVSCYFGKLEPFLDFYPREKIMVLLLEDLKEKPEETLSGIFRFLEVKDDFVPQGTDRAYNKFDERKQNKCDAGEDDLSEMQQYIENPGSLEDDERSRILDRLRTDAEKMSDFMERPLDLWKTEERLEYFFPVP